MTTLAACLRLARTEQVGPRSWRRLVDTYGSPAAALDALPGLARHGKAPLAPPHPDVIQREIDATYALGGTFLTLLDPAYPALLRALPDTPPVLSVLGDITCLQRPAISIVGARNASAHGLRLAESLASELAEQGVLVVSGLARGIDSAAHCGALHRQGLTAAAIAGGLDRPYPPENTQLQARIAANGLVLTEAPLGATPQARSFPRRNRIIAGLSLGCVVVEAAPHSGTLLTARMAVDYGRDLFAVPGSPLDPRCRGSNNLIRKGAILTETAADILPYILGSTLNLATAAAPPPQTPDLFAPHSPPAMQDSPPSPQPGENLHARILDLLSFTPIAVDVLIRRCQFSASAVLIALTELELSGRVTSGPDGRVSLTGKEVGRRR